MSLATRSWLRVFTGVMQDTSAGDGTDAIVAAFTDHLLHVRGYSANTVRAYRTDVNALLEFAGGGVVYLEVRTDNAPAIAVYSSGGWDRAGLRRGYYAPGIDAISTLQREERIASELATLRAKRDKPGRRKR